MKKKLVLLYIIALMCFSSCGLYTAIQDSNQTGVPSDLSLNDGISSFEELSSDKTVNTAFTKVKGFEDFPDNCLMGAKFYYREMKWMEVNAIENLERYLPILQEDYFLVISRYAGSNIVVYEVDGVGENGVILGDIKYEYNNTPSEFALLIDIKAPHYIPNLLVKVEYNNESATFDFCNKNFSGENPSPWNVDNCYIIEGDTTPGITNIESETSSELSSVASKENVTSSEHSYSLPTECVGNPPKNPDEMIGNGTHYNRGELFLDRYFGETDSKVGHALKVIYEVDLPENYTKEYKYPDTESMQYFYSGEFQVRFESYKKDGHFFENGYLNYNNYDQINTGNQIFYVQEPLESSIFGYFLYDDLYIKVIAYPFEHDTRPKETRLFETHINEVMQMIDSFKIIDVYEVRRFG